MKHIFLQITNFFLILLFCRCNQNINDNIIIINKLNSPFAISEDLIIPKSSNLVIEKGAVIIISDSVNIKIYGKLTINGTKKNPVIIKTENDTISWGRIIINSTEKSTIKYTNFINGALTAYNSNFYISNSNFEFRHNRKFDGWPIIYLINSKSIVNNISVINKIDKYVGEGINCIGGSVECLNNTIDNMPDAIEVTRVSKSKIAGNLIQNCYDDAIDINASFDVDIYNNLITHTEDNGISIGGDQSFNDSVKFGKSFNINIIQNIIYKVKTGISVTDSSQVYIESNNICSCNVGIKLFQKNNLFGGAFTEITNNVLLKNNNDYITENSEINEINTLSDFKTQNNEKNELILDTNNFFIKSSKISKDKTFYRFNKIDTNSIISVNNLPQMFINTFPKVINYDEKIDAIFQVYDNKLKTNSGKITIKIRGSSSVDYPKKSYELETEKKQCIINLPEETDWVLYAPSIDKSLLRNALAYSLGQKMSIKSPKFRFLNLYVNDENYGLYLLIQKIKCSEGFVNIEELSEIDSCKPAISGGYIFKIDKGTGANNWISLCNSDSNHLVNYYIHYPKPNSINESQKKYIIQYIKKFESKISKMPLDHNVIDSQSFISYILVNELMKNFDSYRASVYFYKNRNSDKLFIGPIWDFDISSGLALYEEFNTHTGFVFEINDDYRKYIPLWWYNLISDEFFSIKLKEKWFELRKHELSDTQLINLINNLNSQIKNYSIEKETNRLKDWILKRALWIDENIELINIKASAYK
ncbi:MAG: hypothetical protein A2046_11785 [Bacteroidetes bacterium GWA2_30_7]|nr:MAG: hypothetical protein A2046_11785 [Bacteroidetes bacterium GWA2_30_7]